MEKRYRLAQDRHGLFRLASVRWLLLLFVLCLHETALWGQDRREAVERDENQLAAKIKVAYVYNILRLIEWPDGPMEPIRICAIGSDPTQKLLGELSSRKIKERPVTVSTVQQAGSATCHVLYIGASAGKDWPLIQEQTAAVPILTISDIPQFAAQGGMIGFAVENERVIIEINLDAVNRIGLNVSAKLLEIARIIR